MYLSAVRIQNYRCFADQVVQFTSGVNVLLGENNAGKTTVIKVLGLVLDQKSRRRPAFYDFHHPCTDPTSPPPHYHYHNHVSVIDLLSLLVTASHEALIQPYCPSWIDAGELVNFCGNFVEF